MAKKKQLFKGEDPRGQEWQDAANSAWSRAVEEAGDEAAPGLFRRFDPERDEERLETMAPDLPDFAAEASPAVAGEALGRFLYIPEDQSIHDTTRAEKGCRVERLPRLFIHFAHEIEGAVPGEAVPHDLCMG